MYNPNKLKERIDQFINKVSDQENMIKSKVNEIDTEIFKVQCDIDSELKKLVTHELSGNKDAQEMSNKCIYDLRYKFNDLTEKKSMYLRVKEDKDFVRDEIQQLLAFAKQVAVERQEEDTRILTERKKVEEQIYELQRKSENLTNKSNRLSNVDDAYKFSEIMSYIPDIEKVANSKRNLYINALIAGQDVSWFFINKD